MLRFLKSVISRKDKKRILDLAGYAKCELAPLGVFCAAGLSGPWSVPLLPQPTPPPGPVSANLAPKDGNNACLSYQGHCNVLSPPQAAGAGFGFVNADLMLTSLIPHCHPVLNALDCFTCCNTSDSAGWVYRSFLKF